MNRMCGKRESSNVTTVRGEKVGGDALHETGHLVQGLPAPLAALLVGALAPRVVDEHAPHDARRGAQVVGPVPPGNVLFSPEPQVGFVHERRGLQRVPRILGTHVMPCQAAELFVDQREQGLLSAFLAGVQVRQQFRDLVP